MVRWNDITMEDIAGGFYRIGSGLSACFVDGAGYGGADEGRGVLRVDVPGSFCS
jgi:hypothetical protein